MTIKEIVRQKEIGLHSKTLDIYCENKKNGYGCTYQCRVTLR